MKTTYIPGPLDAEMLLEGSAGVTKAIDYNGASKDLGSSYAPGGMGQPVAAVVQVSALDLADETETYAFVLEESADDVTFTPAGPIIDVTATGTISVPGFISQRYCRLRLDVGGDTPSITYKAHLVPLGSVG